MFGVNRIAFILILLLAVPSGIAHAQAQKEQSFMLYMPDGQLIDRPVRVYVIGIEDSKLVEPRLRLVRLRRHVNPLTNQYLDEKGLETVPFDRAKNQTALRKIRGTEETLPDRGTLLLFNLKKFHINWYQPGTRVLPVLHYGDKQSIVADQEVYMCHRLGTILIVLVIVVPLILALNFLSKEDHYLLGLLSTADGRMSISLTQMFLWTVAVGAAVLALGITRLSVPNIHESLIILMGLSVTTSMVGHWQSDLRAKEKLKRKEEYIVEKPKLSHLVMVKVPGAPDDADLVKGQLLFWTIITLTIFVIKSVMEGELWDVPPQLLVLMGISQAGFLTRKQLLLNEEKKKTEEKKKAEESSQKSPEDTDSTGSSS